MPSRDGSSSRQNGLYGASSPALTRRFCLAAWLVPVVQLGTGSYGCSGLDRRKLSASSVPSKNGLPSVCAGEPSSWSGASPFSSDWPCPCGSEVRTTYPSLASVCATYQ